MKYDLTQQLNDHRNEPIVNEAKKPITLGTVLEQTCINGQPKDQSGEAKLRQFKLAQKIATNDSVELSSEDVTLLKTLAASLFSPIAYGSIAEALENPAQKEILQ